MEGLFLEDLKGLTLDEVKAHLIQEYEATEEELENFEILIGYESVGSWGCDSNSFFLLREKKTGKYFGVYGSHCSCYGFEDQFEPEEHSLEYFKSDNFTFYCGGYDYNEENNKAQVKHYIANL